jgi:hypothetical protein
MRVLPQLIKAERFRIDTGSSAIYVEHLDQAPSSSINALTPWTDKQDIRQDFGVTLTSDNIGNATEAGILKHDDATPTPPRKETLDKIINK